LSNLLIHEPPLMVLPSLAKEIGLNEAIVLQQIHYWQQMSRHFHDGKRWIYNSFPKWNEQFPFWSERTLKRIFKSLEDRKLLFVGNYNKLAIDRTKWYSINYEVLNGIGGQNGTTIVSNWHDENANMTRPLPEITTENNNNNICAAKADTKKKSTKRSYSDDFEEIWSIYPKKRNKPKAYQRYKESLDKNHSHDVIKYGNTCYAKDCEKQNTELQYIKMLEGFLNDERYLEYKKVDSKQKPKQTAISIDNLLD